MELKDCLLTDEEKIQANNYSTIGEEYSCWCKAQLSKVLKHLPELEEVKKLVDAAVKAEQERIIRNIETEGAITFLDSYHFQDKKLWAIPYERWQELKVKPTSEVK